MAPHDWVFVITLVVVSLVEIVGALSTAEDRAERPAHRRTTSQLGSRRLEEQIRGV